MTESDRPTSSSEKIPTETGELEIMPPQVHQVEATTAPDPNRPSEELSIGEFLQHCSKFITQHKLFVITICIVIAAIASGGFAAGYWTHKNETAKTTTASTEREQLKLMSENLSVLSETTESNFEGHSYFLDTLTELLRIKGHINDPDAQRLLTGVIIYQHQSKNESEELNPYATFADRIRRRYHVTKTRSYDDPKPDRGIILSSELDESILCDLVKIASDVGLGLKFVSQASASPEENRDKYSIQINVQRVAIPKGSKTKSFDAAKKNCGSEYSE